MAAVNITKQVYTVKEAASDDDDEEEENGDDDNLMMMRRRGKMIPMMMRRITMMIMTMMMYDRALYGGDVELVIFLSRDLLLDNAAKIRKK